ncbi:MAG TPA: flagellar basal body rod C-terminal domain-containing protein [Rhizomicrobium sp.]|nr:flagellar basal body rod C-terminal domain-containing protein [Rhizomicrobium sp.]
MPGHHHGVMGNAMSIAASGMQAASVRLEAAASNIVNMDSGGYQPVSVAQSPAPDGGVSTSLQPVTPASLLAYDPASPYANVQGMVAQPNVDMATEIVNMKEAANSFRASIQAYKTASQMFKTLLDATS